MPTRIQLRRDTAANWTAANPVLAQGELGLETDTSLLKIGNGSAAWSSLPYVSYGAGAVTTLSIPTVDVDPSAPAANAVTFYGKRWAGQDTLGARNAYGYPFALQQSVMAKNLAMITPATSALLNVVGCAVASAGIISHPAVGETFGVTTNLASSASANYGFGISTAVVSWFRSHGWTFFARMGFPDASYDNSGASTGIRIAVGMTSTTGAVSVGADDVAGSYHAMFLRHHVNGGATHTNWQFATKDGTTQLLTDTTVPFAINKVYDFTIFCPPNGDFIGWQVINRTDDVVGSGSVSGHLPTAGTALRASSFAQTINAVVRNFRIQKMAVEADR